MGISVIKIEGRRMNAKHGAELERMLRESWKSGALTVAIDLSSFSTIDSLGVGALVALQRSKPKQAQIVLCGVDVQVRDVLAMTRVSALFRFEENVGDVKEVGESHAS